jgi:Anti-sigma-K factor rskA
VKHPSDPGPGDPLNEIEAFRGQELLLLRATEGLTEAQAAELIELGLADDDSYDLAAAAVDLATLPRHELPSDVAQRLLLAAGVRPPRAASAPAVPSGVPSGVTSGAAPRASSPRLRVPTQPPAEPARTLPSPPTPPAAPTEPTEPLALLTARRSRAPMIVAWTAAAAGLAAAAVAVVWATRKEPTIVVQRVEVPGPPIVTPPPQPPPPSVARAQLLAAAADAQTLPWTATADAAAKGASGDVVWSPSHQEGYLRFVGLAANDPTLQQYQLWIFDKLRDERYPVDGGVFDVGPSGEVVIKIAPKLLVNEPVLFAVTIEPPGGVVVSKRERIVVTASPAKAG